MPTFRENGGRCPPYILASLALCLLAIWSGGAAADSPLDTIELLGGQTLSGQITDPSLKIDSRLGSVDVPADQVLGLACQAPPHVLQMLTTRDGDVLVGRVEASTIHFNQTDGHALELPLIQIKTISAPAGGPTTAPAATAIVYGQRGDRVAIAADFPIQFRTRWGVVNLQSGQVRQLLLNAKNQTGHRVNLTDGSSISGLVAGDSMTLTPQYLAGPVLIVPVEEMTKIELTAGPASPAGPKLDMIGGDVLRGAIKGDLIIETDLGNTPVSAADIDQIAGAPDASGDLNITLSGGRTIHGVAQQTTLTCQLGCGVSLSVPVEMISGYAKSAPAAPADAD